MTRNQTLLPPGHLCEGSITFGADPAARQLSTQLAVVTTPGAVCHRPFGGTL